VKRRTVVGMSALAVGCSRVKRRYFGLNVPPQQQTLTMAIGANPGTLDPGESWDIWEPYPIRALFEGLTDYQPVTLEATAALATHFETAPDFTRFTFYLRGHPSPRGVRLPGDVSTGGSGAANWSDEQTITADDFVYSWRRIVDPINGFPTATLFYPIRNAQLINSGKASRDALGVRALDDSALQVDPREPVPCFLQLVASNQFFPVPRRCVDSAGASWTRPTHIISSGAFCLSKWQDGEIALVANPRYHCAKSVALHQLRFVTISNPTTAISMYKAGSLDLVTPLLPALYMRLLRRLPDFHSHQAIANRYLVINTEKAPFDNVFLRYALNMSLDKKEIERVMGAGPAASALVPPVSGYESPSALPISVGERTYDVLAFDPVGARFMLSAAGYSDGRLKIEYLYPTQGTHRERFEILQKQWKTNLGIDLIPSPKESSVWNQETYSVQYRGMAAWADIGLYPDPTYFLDQFLKGSSANVTGWTDPRYDAAMAEAKSCTPPAIRLRKLAHCERILLEGMPVIPLYFEAWQQLRKPYVRGIEGNSIDAIPFHRAWIDTGWRES
jgi:ABC-type oligopeptide transport system substrate-binding subunit